MRPPAWSGRVLRAAFLLAAVGILLAALRRDGASVWSAVARVGVGGAVGSGVLVLAGLGCSALAWRALVRDLGSPLGRRAAAHVFFLGQLGKYLPGSVFAVAAQMELGRRYRLPRSRVAAAGVLFMAVLTATGLLVATSALPFTGYRGYRVLLLGLPLLVVLLLPPVLTRLVGRALAVTRREPLERPLTGRGVAAAAGWALAMWACYGAHVALLVLPQRHAPGLALPVLATGGYALAWTAGFLVLVAPAGAGVREGVLASVLLAGLGRPSATAVAVLSRGLMTIGDLVWAGIAVSARPRYGVSAPPVATVGPVPQLGKAADG